MAWDPERYRREVLGPARQAGSPPADLFVRYGFTGPVPGAQEFARQVAAAAAEWRKLRNKAGWGRLIDALLNQHAELDQAGELTAAAFERRRRDAREVTARRLRTLIAAQKASHVTPDVVARLREAAGAGTDEEQVQRALAEAGITVIATLPELPDAPPPGYAQLVPELEKLGLKLSAEVVFDPARVKAGFTILNGLRLNGGEQLGEQAIAVAAARIAAVGTSDPRKTPTASVLTSLRTACRDGTLRALVLWELMAQLRHMVGLDLGQKAIADEAHEIGLNAAEAGILAAALLAEKPAAGARRHVEEDLAAGRLRSAQLRATALANDDELRERVHAAAAEVAAMVAAADEELRGGRTEAAAGLLSQALSRVSDAPDLAERLAGLAPPPPSAVTATVDGSRVLLSWQPSVTRFGTLRYRVSRGTGHAPANPTAGTLIASESAEPRAADHGVPVGTDLFYSVFAGRGGPAWSAAASTGAVLAAPDVTDVKSSATADTATVGWRAPAGAAGIQVTRAAGGRRTTVPSDLAGFTDRGLVPGTEYAYRISVVYRGTDGAPRNSPGVTVTVTPTPDPEPVRDLSVVSSPPGVEVSWAPPPIGRVELRISRERPPWQPGTEPPQAELARYGSPVSGVPRPGAGGRVSVRIAPPSGRHHLLAVTWVGARAVAGARAELSLAEPVSVLRAERLLDEAQLSWIWPAEAVDSVIAWPGGQRRCSRRVYNEEGGVSVPVGPGEVTVTVSAVHPDTAAELVAPAVPVTVPARHARVRYRWLSAGPLRSGRRVLELTADLSCELPELVVVHSTAAYPPDEPADGVEIARLPPASVIPGAPLRIPVDLPKKATGYLACFAASPGAGALLLPPPHNEMRIR